MKRSDLWRSGLFVLAVLAACGGSTRGSGSDAGGGRDAGSTGTGGRSGSGGATGGADAGVGANTGGATASGGAAPQDAGSGGAAAGSGGGGGGVGTGGAAMGTGGSFTAGNTQCSDNQDNDGDGRIDLADPDCVSPLDNDESSLATGIAGDNMDACKQDCFFDGNSGMGDDGCEWNLKCDPANTNPGQCMYDPKFNNCPTAQSQKCINNCRKLTPNGCDCFGCCTVPGVNYPIRLTSTCTSASFGDPMKCPACTQSTSCNNDCGRCELCLGKTSIPADCHGTSGTGGAGGSSGGAGGAGGEDTGNADGGTSTPDCQDYRPCGPTGTDPSACSSGEICITGCCIPL